MLADLTGWTVLNNADTFRRVLGDAPVAAEARVRG